MHSIKKREEQLIEELLQFQTAQTLFEYLVKRGKRLPIAPLEHFESQERVQGCQSLLFCRAWVEIEEEEPVLSLALYSDALISKGLASLAYELYHGALLREALLYQLTLLERVETLSTLSMGRTQGFRSLLQAIVQRALQAAKGAL